MQNVVLQSVQAFVNSPEGIVLGSILGYIVLDALLTAALEKKLNRFAPEALSYFLEKIGGEYVGLAILGLAAYLNPVMLAVAAPALAAFLWTESNGVLQKAQAFIDSLSKPVSSGPQVPSAP
jgi:hypothetical protein